MTVDAEIDPHARVNVLSEDENGFWYNLNRVAVRSWARALKWTNDVTPVRPCDRCGLIGGPRKVQYRSDCHDYDGPFPWSRHPFLCMSCWNKVRALYRRLDDLQELRKLTKSLRSQAWHQTRI